MAKTATLPTEDTAAESADLMVMATVNPLTLFTDREQFSQFYKRVKEETDKHVADVSTQKGRDAVRSLARKVTTAKTTLEKAGKGLVEEMRQQVNSITSVRIQMVDEMDALAKEVRRPLTEWENAEKERVERCQAVIDDIKVAAVVSLEDTSETVRARGKELWATEIGEEFGDMTDAANEVKATAIATLQRALERLTKEEADRAELEALREAARLREEEEARVAAAQEQARREAEEQRLYEERRAAAEKAEQERIQREREEAAQAARDEAARAAREAEEQVQREHEAALAVERTQREEAERINREAEARRAAEEAERGRQAEEDRKREANRAHRSRVQGAAKIAIMACGADEATAQKIVRAIVAGDVPNVTLAY